MSKIDIELKQKLLRRFNSLKTARSSWEPHWQKLKKRIAPRMGRFLPSETNRGGDRHEEILDNTAIIASRVLSQGLMSGLTSPARPWFKLRVDDEELMKSSEVKRWLEDVANEMRKVFHNSATYRVLHSMYEELVVFGTSCSIIVGDEDSVIHLYPLTIGEYFLAANAKGQVDTMYRWFGMTAYELVDEFGIENVSYAAKTAYENQDNDLIFDVIHAIEPNPSRNPRKIDSKNMPWRSVYFEDGCSSERFLRVSGYKNFSVLCPRWGTIGRDVYGYSPAMDALGDTLSLYTMEESKASGVAMVSNPHLVLPASMKGQKIRPGGVSFLDISSSNFIGSPLNVTPINLNDLTRDIDVMKARIREAFYVDMFLIISGQNDTQMTATEVAERREEKMMMLGPVVERLQNELIMPLIEYTFDYLADSGLMPPVPEALQGVEYKVELIGMMAQAQQAIQANSITRFLNAVTGMAQLKPEVIDNIDPDEYSRLMADLYGVGEKLIMKKSDVQKIRSARAMSQQAAQQAALENQAADTASKLSSASTGDGSLLEDVLSQTSGYTGAVQ